MNDQQQQQEPRRQQRDPLELFDYFVIAIMVSFLISGVGFTCGMVVRAFRLGAGV